MVSTNRVYTLNIRAVKTQQTICEVVSQCNVHQYVRNSHMFRPCKRAIIRLFLEPVIRHKQWEYGGTRSRLTLYMWGYSIWYSEVFLLYTIRVLWNTFLSVVPGVLVGLVVYCGRGSYVAGKTLGQMSYPHVGVSVSMPCVFIRLPLWERVVLYCNPTCIM
jgi:hypothetical protein